MAEFNRFAPAIDRCFRFIEMIGVTALLGTVFSSQGAAVANYIVFIGTILAITYLIEPVIHMIALSVIGKNRPSKLRLLGAVVVLFISFMATIKAAPFVSRLAILIGETLA